MKIRIQFEIPDNSAVSIQEIFEKAPNREFVDALSLSSAGLNELRHWGLIQMVDKRNLEIVNGGVEMRFIQVRMTAMGERVGEHLKKAGARSK